MPKCDFNKVALQLLLFWCMFIVFTSINGLIQGIASTTESSFFIIFYIDKMTTVRYRFKGCFSVSTKFSKISQKHINKRWTHFWEIRFQNYATLYQHPWQQFEMHWQSVRETATLLYNRMMANMGYGREGLKDIVEKEAEEQQQKPTTRTSSSQRTTTGWW